MATNKKEMYIVGRLSGDYFYLGDSRQISANYMDAKKELFKMRRVKPMGDVKIFKIDAEVLQEIEVDPDINVVENAVRILKDEIGLDKNISWWTDDSFNSSSSQSIFPRVSSSVENRTITILYRDVKPRYIYPSPGADALGERGRQMINDLNNLVKYCFMKEVEKALKKHNLSVKVEFKCNGKKMHKGFITKGE